MLFRTTALAAALAVVPSAFAEDVPVFIGDEIVVTAARFPASLRHEPSSISVLTRQDIESNPAASLPELLATLPGVQVRNASGSPEYAIDLRGFGATGNQNTLVLLDGQRLNENELVSIKWTSIPVEAIERIEVIRGAGAVMYGGGASGGVINIITRKPSKMNGLKSAAISAGNYGLKEGSVYLSGAGPLAWSVAGNIIDTDNYRDNNALEQKNLNATAQFSEWTLRAGLEDQDLGLPGARSRTQLATDPRGTATPRDFSTRGGWFAAAGWNRQLQSGRLSVDAGFRHSDRTALFDDYSLDFWDAKSFLNTETRNISLQPRIELRNAWGGESGKMVLGLDWDDWDYDSKRYTGPETVPGAAGATTLSAHITARQHNLSAYARQSLELGPATHLTLGGRIQHTRSKAQDHASTQPYASGSRSDTPWAAEIGLKREFGSGLAAFGRLGHSFRVATVDEMYDPYGGPSWDAEINPLKPQTSDDAELGLQYSSRALTGRLTAYGMNLRNEIHYNALTFTNQNLAPTRRYGFEAEAEHRFSAGFKMRAGYAYTVAQFREGNYGGTDVSGNDIPLVPRHSASLIAGWQPLAGQLVSLAARYVGEQRFDNDQANNFGEKMPAYTVVDLKWQGEWKDWKAFAAINNLLDEEYFSYAVRSLFTSNFNAYPMPERNYRVGLEYVFR
jgi:iron complex outermembrane receptor protein